MDVCSSAFRGQRQFVDAYSWKCTKSPVVNGNSCATHFPIKPNVSPHKVNIAAQANMMACKGRWQPPTTLAQGCRLWTRRNERPQVFTFWSMSSSPPEESLRSDTGRVQELPPDTSRSARLSLPWFVPGPAVPVPEAEAAAGPRVEELMPVGSPDTVATSRAIFPTEVDALIWYQSSRALSAWFEGLVNNASAAERRGGMRGRFRISYAWNAFSRTYTHTTIKGLAKWVGR